MLIDLFSIPFDIILNTVAIAVSLMLRIFGSLLIIALMVLMIMGATLQFRDNYTNNYIKELSAMESHELIQSY